MASNITPADLMEEQTAIFRQRSTEYGEAYKEFGALAQEFLAMANRGKVPSPHLHNLSAAQLSRLGVLVQMLSKLTRYAHSYWAGGHDDSLADLAVYTTMLRELDAAARRPPPPVPPAMPEQQ